MDKKNELLTKIMSTIVIAGIIQIICVLAVTVLNYAQNRRYEKVIQSSCNISKDVNDMMIGIYGTQDIITNYMKNGFSNEITSEINRQQKTAEKACNNLSKDVTIVKNSEIVELYADIRSQYTILSNNMESLKNKIKRNEEITSFEYDNLIDQPLKNLQGSNGELIVLITLQNESDIQINSYFSSIVMIMNIVMAITIIVTIFICASVVMKNSKIMADKQILAEKTADESIGKAYTDNLTGLWNRKYTEMIVNRIIQEKGTGCLFMFDLDNFKSVNDTYGHIAGDNVLKAFARALMKTSREYDICCRVGGDEFMLFAKRLPEDQIKILAERIIKNSLLEFKIIEGGKDVTLSIGITPITSKINNFQELYDKADTALYHIKRNGKNSYYTEK